MSIGMAITATYAGAQKQEHRSSNVLDPRLTRCPQSKFGFVTSFPP
jgi:hypothetical protein